MSLTSFSTVWSFLRGITSFSKAWSSLAYSRSSTQDAWSAFARGSKLVTFRGIRVPCQIRAPWHTLGAPLETLGALCKRLEASHCSYFLPCTPLSAHRAPGKVLELHPRTKLSPHTPTCGNLIQEGRHIRATLIPRVRSTKRRRAELRFLLVADCVCRL